MGKVTKSVCHAVLPQTAQPRWEICCRSHGQFRNDRFLPLKLEPPISEQLLDMSTEWSVSHPTERIVGELRSIGDLEVKILRI